MSDLNMQKEIEKYTKEAMEYAKRALPVVDVLKNDEEILEAFLAEYPGRGVLKIQITSGNSDLPVKDAEVTVFKDLENKTITIYKNKTDESGILDDLILPALPASLSQTEVTATDGGTAYTVLVKHPMYLDNTQKSVLIYDKVKTILPIALQPKIL